VSTENDSPRDSRGPSRRDLLKTGVVAGAMLAAGPPASPRPGGILRVRGWDPPHFDPHQTRSFMTMTTLSFVYSKLLRHKVGAGVPAGSFMLEPDLAERWEQPDETTYIFHLRKGVRWHNKPPVNGRELTAEDVKFTYTRFLTVKGNPERYLLDSVERVEAVDRYTVKFALGEPYVWLPHKLANALCTWIVAPEVVEMYGDLKRPETAIGTGPFTLERYDRTEWSGWSSRTTPRDSPRTAPGRSTPVPGPGGPCASRIWISSRRLTRICFTRISWATWSTQSRFGPTSRPSRTFACGAPSHARSIAGR